MADFFYRTEDIKPEEIPTYFVETKRDREILNALKARNPVVLAGSRGVGKSFLLRVAQSELLNSLGQDYVLPVYVTFSKSSLINTEDPEQFEHWMLARICARIVRDLSTNGLLGADPASMAILTGGDTDNSGQTKMEQIADAFEESWKQQSASVDLKGLPSVEAFKDAIEDLCRSLSLSRVVLLIDEAAHIFLPQQQRQFFTLFRDLRSPYITCKAAVYPGVTSYGETFQPIHDATMLALERNVLDSDYIENMREIVVKQAQSDLITDVARHGENFAILAYAATGNPRVLLKTLNRAKKVTNQSVNEVIREYYRVDIWAEHSTLPDKYAGHRTLIDWGRNFIERDVLPDLYKRKNFSFVRGDEEHNGETSQRSTCFFWIHRDAPQPVKEALRLLAYTGIVSENASGIRATRSEVGTRYMVNLGCLFSLEATPTKVAFQLANNLDPRRMSEFGANHPAYQSLLSAVPEFVEPAIGETLRRQLAKSIDVLDITEWQRGGLRELNITTIGEVLHSTEMNLQRIAYVGEKRSRRMRNAAIAAVYEYLSG
jgi:hypothetical protein